MEIGPFTLVGFIVKNDSHLAPTLSLLLLGNELPPMGSSDLIFYQLCLAVPRLKPCHVKWAEYFDWIGDERDEKGFTFVS